MPCPTNSRTTENPCASTCCWTACPRSPSRLPGLVVLEEARARFDAPGRAETAIAARLTAGGVPVALAGGVGVTLKDDHNLWTLDADTEGAEPEDVTEQLGRLEGLTSFGRDGQGRVLLTVADGRVLRLAAE